VFHALSISFSYMFYLGLVSVSGFKEVSHLVFYLSLDYGHTQAHSLVVNHMCLGD
jgi:hypothetical protein